MRRNTYIVKLPLFWTLIFVLYFPCGNAQPPCVPCGQSYASDIPLPSYAPLAVQPMDNYLAAYHPAVICPHWGFYIGTGFGFGDIDYNLSIPGFTFNDSDTYMVERAVIGYIHPINQFVIGIELGYNYRSVTEPIRYDDPSVIVFQNFIGGALQPQFTVTPCQVRLDIDAQSSLSLDLLPGVMVTPQLLFYARIGGEAGNFTWHRRLCVPATTLTQIPALQFNVNFTADDIEVTDSQTDYIFSYRLGVGAAYAVGRHVSFNLNATHIAGGSATFTPNATAFVNAFPVFITTLPFTTANLSNLTTLLAENRIEPTRNEVTFGVNFTF